jgi:hypothetical protein
MTVETTENKMLYAGLPGQDTFAYTFLVQEKSDMNVLLAGILIPDGDWTITGLGEDFGGEVILNTPLIGAMTVTLYRLVPETQQVDYQPYDAFPAETHESALDKLTLICQQLQEQVNRAYKAPVDGSGPGVDFQFPPYSPGAFIAWSETVADLLVNSPYTIDDIEAAVADAELAAAESAVSAAESATSAGEAVDSALESADSAVLSAQFANFPEDVIVEDGLYSAKHWAIKSARARGGLNLIAIIAGDDLCPKSGDDPGDCTAPDHRNPTQRFTDYDFLAGDYFIISNDGNMDLKVVDDPTGPETTQAVFAADYVIFLPELRDDLDVIIIGQGWYRQEGIIQGTLPASDVTFDDSMTTIKGTNVQTWNFNADLELFRKDMLLGYSDDGISESYIGDLNDIITNSAYCFRGDNVTNEPTDFVATQWGTIITYPYVDAGTERYTQVIYGMNNDNAYKQWMRWATGGVWEAWKKVIDGSKLTISDAGTFGFALSPTANNQPTNVNHLTRKDYVDGEVSDLADTVIPFNDYFDGFVDDGLHTTYTGNLNSIVVNSEYFITAGGVTNEPVEFSSNGMIRTVMANADNAAVQFLYGHGTADKGKQWGRTLLTGAWEAWVKVIDGAATLIDEAGQVSFLQVVPTTNFGPTKAADLCNKNYVDGQIAAVSGNQFPYTAFGVLLDDDGTIYNDNGFVTGVRLALGQYQLNFINPQPNGNYSILVSSRGQTGRAVQYWNQTKDQVLLFVYSMSGSPGSGDVAFMMTRSDQPFV